MLLCSQGLKDNTNSSQTEVNRLHVESVAEEQQRLQWQPTVTRGANNSSTERRGDIEYTNNIIPSAGIIGLHNTNNKQYQLSLTTAPNGHGSVNSDNDNCESCLAEDCNLQTGEIVRTMASNVVVTPPVTTIAYLNTTTSTLFSTSYQSLLYPTYTAQWPLLTVTTTTMYDSRPTHTKVPPQVVTPGLDRRNLTMEKMFDMLTLISMQVAAGNAETRALRDEVSTFNQQITATNQTVEDQGLLLKEAITNYNKCADKMEILTGVTVRQEKEIKKLQDKLEGMEATANRHKLIITGIQDKEGENVVHEVLAFFKAKLLIQETIELQYARHFGQGENKSIEVALTHIKHKGLIYKHLKNLKDVKNEKGYRYQVRDHLPERLQEEDYRRCKIMRDNRVKARTNTAHKIDMSVKCNQLYMNNTLFKKQAPAPTAWELLGMDDEDRERVQQVRLASTNIHKEKNNSFITYVLEAGDMQEVRSSYRHLKLKHPDSTSITVAYNIASKNPEYCDYEDNGEVGAGAQMLKAITDAKHSNVALFLVRYHSGQNLGTRRFAIFKDQAAEALALLENRENFFASRLPAAKLAVKAKNKGVRTRGKMYGNRGASHSSHRRFTPTPASGIITSMESDVDTMDTDTDAEVVLKAKKNMKINDTENVFA